MSRKGHLVLSLQLVRVNSTRMATVTTKGKKQGEVAVDGRHLIVTVLDGPWDDGINVEDSVNLIYKLDVKGNLKHRCSKLGMEGAWETLLECQKLLRRVAWSQFWVPAVSNVSMHAYTPEEESVCDSMMDSGVLRFEPVRPLFGGGAAFFLTPEHSERLVNDLELWKELCNG